MATTRPTPEELKAVEKAFLAARAIPIMHLVSQFCAPSDAKSAAAGDQKSQFPAMNQNEAFERLRNRLGMSINPIDEAAFKAQIEKIRAQKNPSSNEHIILGLAHLYGYGPKQDVDTDAAFNEFELAVKADETNAYAHALLGERYFYKKRWFGRTYDTEALACFNKSIEKAPETIGLAYAHRGWIRHRGDKTLANKEQALNDAKIAAKLNNHAGINLYCYLINDDTRKVHLANLVGIEGNPSIYTFYLLDSKSEAATKMYELSAEHANYAAVYNAAKHIRVVRKDFTRAARYYCAVLFFPRLKDQHLEATHFLENEHVGNNIITYYSAMAHNETDVFDDMLKRAPKTFISLWQLDYDKPLHPKIKERAIAYVSKLEPGKITSAETCQMLAKAFSACAEPDLKRKGRAFSLATQTAEVDPTQLTADRNNDLAAALRASSEKSLNKKAQVFELAAEKKRKEEAATRKLAEEKATNLALPKGVVANYTVAATGGSGSAHSINTPALDGANVAPSRQNKK